MTVNANAQIGTWGTSTVQATTPGDCNISGNTTIGNNISILGNEFVTGNLNVFGNTGVIGDLYTSGVFYAGTSNVTSLNVTGYTKMGAVTIPSGGGYMLYVGQGILTEKLKVANSTDAMNWSDFVFNKEYKLRSLYDVESYINTNKHLPEIPSAKEVAADGIDVASIDAKLLQKIEELTLYVIQQQKEIDELKKERKH